MIIPRKFVGSAILDNQLYAVGGINDQYGDLMTVEACNLLTNQWSSLASLQACKGKPHNSLRFFNLTLLFHVFI